MPRKFDPSTTQIELMRTLPHGEEHCARSIGVHRNTVHQFRVEMGWHTPLIRRGRNGAPRKDPNPIPIAVRVEPSPIPPSHLKLAQFDPIVARANRYRTTGRIIDSKKGVEED